MECMLEVYLDDKSAIDRACLTAEYWDARAVSRLTICHLASSALSIFLVGHVRKAGCSGCN